MARHRRPTHRRPPLRGARRRPRPRAAAAAALLSGMVVAGLVTGITVTTRPQLDDGPARLGAAGIPTGGPPVPSVGPPGRFPDSSSGRSSSGRSVGPSADASGRPPSAGAAPATGSALAAGSTPGDAVSGDAVSGGDEVSLLWSDEFDGPRGAAPDPGTWITQAGAGWGDREMQCYTTDRRNLAIDGRGHLVITARREPSCGEAEFSSGRIETLGRRTMRYGYLEARAVLPTGQGSFPAIWLLGSNMPEVDWPASGELDVVETVSTAPTTVHTNVHGVDESGAHWQATWGRGGMHDAGVDLAADFHTYGLEWTPSALRFVFDGRTIRTLTRDDVPVWLWDKDHYVILNVAVNRGGAQATAADYPQRMIVDYVRVFSGRP
ncbi:glycoside hydrolase family 16 protein [Parafrankia elaeagni]|uniref:glycoside hydrolase family 16 protein n=1 Tax=Parafrankia elaeagni TaxID=222534 RepID=UPI0003A8910E|nr:glycoside hydrolase family 16 protein [Parafrankia elaeagni]